MPLDEETVLLQRIAGGDEAAFRKLVHGYSDLLATHIYRLTHSREQTEEIVQDVFLKVWMTREALAGVRNFRTWLYVISRNQATDALRAIIREKTKFSEWRKDAGPVVEEDNSLKEERLSVIDQAIAQLPVQQKKAWVLSRYEGKKYTEIAAEMGISPETVKKHIQSASLSIIRFVEGHLGMVLLGILAGPEVAAALPS